MDEFKTRLIILRRSYMKKKIVLWGLGERLNRYMKFDYFSNCEIQAFIDTYKKEGIFYGRQVYAPDVLPQLIDEIDYLVIATQYFSEIYNLCMQMHIPKEKIILTDIVNEDMFHVDLDVINAISPLLYKSMRVNQYRFIKMNGADSFDENRLIGNGKYARFSYMSDYFRFRTFEFVAEEIIQNHVEGDLAEFGVFRGAFSSLISEKFHNRKIFLFDTFEGFDKEEAQREAELGHSDKEFEYAHTRTSEEMVLANMPYPKQCIICKGLFPQSITNWAEQTRYAFVSIDVDFEDSIYEGIKFFYQRLNEGGYIFIHDYINPYLKGVKKAVRRYEREENTVLKKVPLADWAGTLVIVK